MAINRPVTKTLISTAAWGIPITDEVNRLAGLVDGLTPTPWTTPTTSNGWVNFAATPLQYRKVGDMVQLRGRVDNGTIGFNTIFTLPVGFRPPKDLQLAAAGVVSGAWRTESFFINASGTVTDAGWQALTVYSFNNQFSITP